MRLPRLSIDNFQFTIVVFVLVVFAGLSSYLNMPRSENPVMSVPGATVIVIYPGANPMDMEELIASPIEDAINELDDIKKIESNIQDGLLVTNVEFIFGTDASEKYNEVVQKVNSVRNDLPEGIFEPNVQEWKSTDVAILQMAFVSDSADFSIMKDEAEKLKKEIEKVNGVKTVKIHACPDKEVRVSLDLEKMAQMNISLDYVTNAIVSNNANIPGGSINISDKSFNIKTSGSYANLYELENTIVFTYKGKLVYLKNIAKVDYAYEDNNWLARYDGRRAIFLEVQQKEHFNIFDIMDGIRPKITDHQKEINNGISLHYVFDQSIGVEARINSFMRNLGQGILLVGILILLALGFKSALIVIFAIPLSVLIGLGIVDTVGFGLQQMSIAGLVVALGLLVDNSIVMVENINRFISLGFKPREASIKAATQIGWPIVSATVTTVLAFVPILMMPDKSGDFIRSLPVTIMATLGVSLFIALTLNPLVTSKVFKPIKELKEGREKKSVFSRALDKFIEGTYRRILILSLKRRFLTIGIALLALIGSLVLFVTSVGVSFFPPAETPQLMIRATLSDGSNLKKTCEVASYIESVLDTLDDVNYYATNIGHGNPRIYYNEFMKNYTKNFSETYVQLKEYDYTEFNQLVNSLRTQFESYPDAKIFVKVFEQGPPQEAPFELLIIGEELEVLKKIAKDVEGFVKLQPGAINIDNQLDVNRTDLFFDINREKAGMFGVPIHEIDKTIRMAASGLKVSEYRDKNGKEYEIIVRLAEGDTIKIEDFSKVYVSSMSGRQIPLNQLATIKFKKAPGLIKRYNLDRTAKITANILEGHSLDDVVDAVISQLDEYNFPRGYYYHFAGEVEARQESFGGMQRAVVLALISIFAVLVLQFKSFTQPLIIYSAIPLAIIGSVLALWATGYTFSFTAFIGLTSLVGIVINNSIILVDYTNKLREEGKELDDAIREAGETRFTPIVLTTLTTVGGLLPLTLQGGEMWAPMGWTIIGGLLISTLLTLVVVPVLYKLFSSKTRFCPKCD